MSTSLMRQQIHTQNSPPPLDAAAYDILATVDYIVRQAAIRGNQFDDAQVAMLKASAEGLRRELRVAGRVPA